MNNISICTDVNLKKCKLSMKWLLTETALYLHETSENLSKEDQHI